MAGARPPVVGALALVASGILAIVVCRRHHDLPDPPRPLEPPRHRPALYAACLPGAACLLVAASRHLTAPDGSGAERVWILGLTLLLVPGLLDWANRARRRPPEANRRTRRLAAVAGALFVFAFAIRLWGGIDRIPGWLDADEARTAVDGQALLAEGPRAAFAFWDMGNPGMTLVVSQLAARPFGDGLRAIRLGSALLGSLTVVLLFDFGCRLVGTSTAFLASLLLAVNHVFLHWSRAGQIYIDTPFFASLSLALLLRALTGGSFLATVGAAIALGVGAITYVPTELLPPLVAVVLAGWAIVLRWELRRILPFALLLGIIVILVTAPAVVTILRIRPEIAFQRVPAISLLRPDGLRQLALADHAASTSEALADHALQTVGIFNFGSDHFPAYGADRALDDFASAALVPVAFALLLSRLSSPLGWLCVVFTGAYLAGGVFFCWSPPTFHRIAVVLLFSSLGVAWALVGLMRSLAVGAGLPPGTAAAGSAAVVVLSAGLNLHYYFRELPRVDLVDAGFGAGRLVCRFGQVRTVIDATPLDRDVPAPNPYPEVDCPGAKRVRVTDPSRLWDFGAIEDRSFILIVPTAVEAVHPGPPDGYRVTRRLVDESIRLPRPLKLSVLEVERAP